MVIEQKDWIRVVFFLLLSVFIFSQGLNIHGLEYRDDEIFYFQSTKEMLKTGNIWSPTYFGQDRFQKPILYYWLVLGSYKIFGINWFSARFVAVVFAALTVCLTWLIAREFFDKKVADLSALILMTIPLFFRHARNVVPDMPLNFFIVLAIYCFMKFLRNSQFSIAFFFVCASGFMIKGFAAWIVPIGTVIVYACVIQKPKMLLEIRFGRGFLLMLLIILPWFLFMIKLHGKAYLNYMLIDETKNRLLGTDQGGSSIIEKGKMFFPHMNFYIKNIFSYFAPWSVFIFPAIPLAIKYQKMENNKENPLLLLLVWFGVVFFFFSSMYFVINHYMLVLSTPFAILVSYFFLKEIEGPALLKKIVVFLKKYSIIVILGAGCFVISFLTVFIATYSSWWLTLFFCGCIFLAWIIHKNSELMVAPVILGVFMLTILSQSALLGKEGITTQSILQRFAKVVHKEKEENFVISVGSQDIHEKEFQVYFDKKIEKVATSEGQETKQRLTKLFKEDKKIYCLMTEKDYKKYLKEPRIPGIQIVQEEYMMRRRMAIDRAFFIAVLKLDQRTVYNYLMEKIVLVRKNKL